MEVVRRSALLDTIQSRELANRQRADFHQLIVCTAGSGTHVVDFESVELTAGTLLRIHPGQVQQFVPNSNLEAHMVVWPVESHPDDPEARPWFPGSGAATRWHLDDEVFAKVLGWIEELQEEQERFDGAPRAIALMQALLRSLLLRLAIETSQTTTTDSKLPVPYLEFREAIEQQLYKRPGIADLARELGYSSRTLDRACQQVSGQTAKQVLDERVALEIRRLLTHSSRPITRIATDFGFSDQSNFSKFVNRHLGGSPRLIRSGDLEKR